MQKVYKWGILGPGNIAHRFADSLKTLPNSQLYACASTNAERAKAFSDEYSAPQWYDSYEKLVKDPEIDAVYISTTNQKHLDCVTLALDNGKPVLCEKPLAVNARQTEKMIESAKKNGVFLMEAMWTRFFPLMGELQKLLDDKVIGDIRAIVGDFSYDMPGFSTSETVYRGFDPDCAGGGLLDVGIYVLSFACKVLGKTPTSVSGLATMSPLNVDAHSIAVFGFDAGEIVSAYSGLDCVSSWEATIYGSKGFIRVNNFFQPDTMTIHHANGNIEKIVVPFDNPGMQYEIMELQHCVEQDKKESDVMPLDESLRIMQAFDELRAKWGLKYPCE